MDATQRQISKLNAQLKHEKKKMAKLIDENVQMAVTIGELKQTIKHLEKQLGVGDEKEYYTTNR